MATLGVPYSKSEVFHARTEAEAQAKKIAEEVAVQGGPKNLHDRKIVALVAYLQRLGVDIQKPPQTILPLVADR